MLIIILVTHVILFFFFLQRFEYDSLTGEQGREKSFEELKNSLVILHFKALKSATTSRLNGELEIVGVFLPSAGFKPELLRGRCGDGTFSVSLLSPLFIRFDPCLGD